MESGKEKTLPAAELKFWQQGEGVDEDGSCFNLPQRFLLTVVQRRAHQRGGEKYEHLETRSTAVYLLIRAADAVILQASTLCNQGPIH